MEETPEVKATTPKAPKNAPLKMGNGGPSPGSRDKSNIDIEAMRLYVGRLKAKADQDAAKKEGTR